MENRRGPEFKAESKELKRRKVFETTLELVDYLTASSRAGESVAIQVTDIDEENRNVETFQKGVLALGLKEKDANHESSFHNVDYQLIDILEREEADRAIEFIESFLDSDGSVNGYLNY